MPGYSLAMRLRLIAVGTRMPDWVSAGVAEYLPRLPREWRYEIVEVPVASRAGNADIGRLRDLEGEKMLKQVPDGAHVVAFDERGALHTTVEWAASLKRWEREHKDIALLVGGPDGLAPACLARAREKWSLSKLTLPHGMVRVLATEALYRAASLNAGHPYHRP
jgi:23S rRNA (pseudouridine1915-N3)-methyltransferase